MESRSRIIDRAFGMPEKMIAQAFGTLAANSGKIGTLNITPDLLESLTDR